MQRKQWLSVSRVSAFSDVHAIWLRSKFCGRARGTLEQILIWGIFAIVVAVAATGPGRRPFRMVRSRLCDLAVAGGHPARIVAETWG